MASSRPIVLDVGSVQDFVQHVLKHHAPPSTLIVCSTRDAFMTSLRLAPQTTRSSDGLGHWLRTPTLRLLSTSRTLRVVFCPDVTHLRAYLATYSIAVADRTVEAGSARPKDVQPILAILNPIELHRPTSAFSAQGLNRTFSVAIEATHVTNSKLILAEISPSPTTGQSPDPWEEELSILNVTTKRLGDLSVGRTVKARTVARRWCTFENMPRPVGR